jgi:hypothetical protein
MGGSHHGLFEGNLAYNYDQDETWGSSIYNIALRNHLTGDRSAFTEFGNPRTIGLGFGNYWNAFFGNVLGTSDMTWTVFEDPGDGTYGNTSQVWGLQTPAIYRLGYASGPNAGQFPESRVRETVMRDGNWDYVTDSVKWDRTDSFGDLPDSLYLASAPDYFSGYTWPWVEAEGATKTYTLPAKVRADARMAARTAPLVPHLNAIARTGEQSVTVYFSPPYYDGGSVINTYTVTSNPHGITATRTGVTAKNDALVIGGLALNTEYTFTITAANALGTSPATPPSDPVILNGSIGPTSNIARVQFAYGANGGVNVNPQTATFSGNVTAGNMVVVFTRTQVSPPNGLANVTGGATGTETLFATHLLPGSNSPQLGIFSTVVASTGPYTVNCNFNTVSFWQWCAAIEYSPGEGAIWNSDPATRYKTDSDGTRTYTVDLTTPLIGTTSGGILLMAASQPQPATFSAGADFTLITGTINVSGQNFGGIQEFITSDPLVAYQAEMDSTAVTNGREIWGFFNTTPTEEAVVVRNLRLPRLKGGVGALIHP